nr:helix-turn-helix domain-containing protein [Candidatus Njordarchaeota archaeon]
MFFLIPSYVNDKDCDQNRKKPAWKFRELKVSALSVDEWNYIRGLFLADGCSGVEEGERGSRAYRIRFFFGRRAEEDMLVHRVIELMIKAGLPPKMRKDPHENMTIVSVCSKSLLNFLPNKAMLREDASERKAFVDRNKLSTTKRGIAFVAGLLDGDGYCDIHVNKRRCTFGEVRRWRWVFSQRRYPFLAAYLKSYVESLAPDSVHTSIQTNGVCVINIRKSGIEAMLNEGIANYSWRVADWLKRFSEAKSERMKYCTTGELARMLNISRDTVRKWLKDKKMRYVRRTNGNTDRNLSYYYIPLEEAKKFRKMIEEEKKIRCKESGAMG